MWGIAAGARSLLFLGLAFALSGAPARAADPEVATEPPNARDVLTAMSRFLGKQESFSYHAEIVFDQILPGGPKIQLSGAVDVAVKRPGSMFVHYRDDLSDRVIWFEEGQLTLYDPIPGTYAVVSGPASIDAMVEKLEKERGLALPLAEFAESDPFAVLTRGVDLTHYVGVHDVEGIFCHHVVLQRPDLDLQVFVEVGEMPLPRKLVFEYPNQTGSPQFTASITEWSFDSPPADRFAAKLPQDVAEVEFLPIEETR
jgi:hypothetical protein